VDRILYTEGISDESIRPGTPFVQVIQEQTVTCPYCGERIDILLDLSVPYQNYIEDCQVCCQPIVFDISVDEDGGVFVEAKSENE
jgi:hypothetical protein